MRGLICSDKVTPLNPIPYRTGTCNFSISHDEAFAASYFANEELPLCPVCKCPLRTETVMFGQPLPENVMNVASELVAQADLLFIIGSTLVVRPANSLPEIAIQMGVPIIMINLDNTQYDSYATALIREPAGEYLNMVHRILTTY
jgi:NAD-dependent SIR2 family protein deacetylase